MLFRNSSGHIASASLPNFVFNSLQAPSLIVEASAEALSRANGLLRSTLASYILGLDEEGAKSRKHMEGIFFHLCFQLYLTHFNCILRFFSLFAFFSLVMDKCDVAFLCSYCISGRIAD